jgi:uncharacterized protein
MSKEFTARRLDVRSLAEEAAQLQGRDGIAVHQRLMAETQNRGSDLAVNWSARGELRHPGHVQPQIWLHLRADAVLPLTCQRCLGVVELPVAVERSFRFVDDEETAAAQDDQSEEDVLALDRGLDLVELIEDELLMELPVAPRHEVCPEPVTMAVADPDFEAAAERAENPFALLEKLKAAKH